MPNRPLKMTSTTSTASLLCAASSFSSSPKFTSKSPAKSQLSSLPTVKFEAITTTTDDASGQNCFSVCNRRKGLVFIASLSFLLPLSHPKEEGLSAKAIESGSTEYRLMKEEIRKVVSKGKAAGVLRLVFHDAGTFEMDENSGVSWADMIAMAGAEAVSVCGGPTFAVPLGRLDSAAPDPEGKLPEESLDASSLKQCFQRKGLSTKELVALSGAHTLGSKGFGNPTVFDNSYYKILLEKPWTSSGAMSGMIGLPSDRALVEDDECLRWITKYANNQKIFFEDFKNAYIKLVNSGARWKSI